MKEVSTDRLLQQTAQILAASRRTAAGQQASEFGTDARLAQVGDLVLLAASAEFPVEWLLLEPDPEQEGQFLAVPADTNPVAGSHDFPLPATASLAPLTLRLAVPLSIQVPARGTSATKRGSLQPDLLQRALVLRQEILRGQVKASERQRETDVDPDYEDWMREVVEPALDAVRRSARPKTTTPGITTMILPAMQPAMVPARWFYSLAAAFALVTVGLSGWIALQEQQLALPVFDLPLEEVRLNSGERAPEHFKVPASARHLMLFLVLRGRDSCSGYGLEILNSAGQVVQGKSDFEVLMGTEIRLLVPREQWRDGVLHLRYSALCDGQKVILDQKSIPIETVP